MFKGILIGIIITCAGWFVFGRITTAEVESAIGRVNGDFKRIERVVSELGDNSDGFADKIALVGTKSGDIQERSQSLDRTSVEGFGDIERDIKYITSGVGRLEEWNRQRILVDRRLADIAFEFRHFYEEYEVQD